MNGSMALWGNGLFLATLCAVLGIVGFVNARCGEGRQLTSGMVMQSVLLMFVVAGRHFDGGRELQLGALAMGGLLIIYSISSRPSAANGTTQQQDRPA